MAWEITEPLNGDVEANGAADIRTLKTDLQTAFRANAADGVEAVFPGASLAAPVFAYRGKKGTTAELPSATDHGLYFDTSRSTLRRSNGSSWVDIATAIPSGTKSIFYNATAPVGWTQDVTNDDKALRCVTGAGGGTGGSVAVSANIAHTHALETHAHSISSDGDHFHSSTGLDVVPSPVVAIDSGYWLSITSTDGSHTHTLGGGTGTSANTTLSLAYIDVIACAKD